MYIIHYCNKCMFFSGKRKLATRGHECQMCSYKNSSPAIHHLHLYTSGIHIHQCSTCVCVISINGTNGLLQKIELKSANKRSRRTIGTVSNTCRCIVISNISQLHVKGRPSQNDANGCGQIINVQKSSTQN